MSGALLSDITNGASVMVRGSAAGQTIKAIDRNPDPGDHLRRHARRRAAHPAQLPAGAAIFAIGRAGPDGTLSATAVAEVSQFPSGAQLNVNLSVKDCSPRSIDEALGAVSAAPVSAGSQPSVIRNERVFLPSTR